MRVAMIGGQTLPLEWTMVLSRAVGGIVRAALALAVAGGLAACGGQHEPLPPGPEVATSEYQIGPGDSLQVFVWRNPELSVTVPVRPDGKISLPLVEDLQAARTTPTQLARSIEKEMKVFLQDPVVTVIVASFVGPYSQQVRVIGEAQQPQALPFREDMSLLDVMIAVGGLTRFASGDRAVLVRKVDGQSKEFNVYIDRLLKDGDMTANTAMAPGDVLIIPQSWF